MDYNELKKTPIKTALAILELMKTASESTNAIEKAYLEEMAFSLAEDITQWYEGTKLECEKKGLLKEFYEDKIVIIVVEILRKVWELYENPKAERLPPELLELIEKKEPKEAEFSNIPLFKSMTQKKDAGIANFGNDRKITVLKKKGSLGQYHAAALNTAVKAFRYGKVTTDGYIVLTENQAIKTMLGTNGTPSEKQKADFRQAWEDMREESFTYETSETMAQIMGISQEQLEDFIPGIKPKKTNIVDDYFIQGLKVIRSQTVNGKETDIYLIKPSDVVRKCIELFPWYETIDAETLRILEPDTNGTLKPWRYSKQRVELQTYILSWLSRFRNSRAVGKQFSPHLPYEQIFSECGLDMKYREQIKRNKKSVHLILDHLQRCGHIAKWEEYTVKTGVVQGVKITLFKERYE